VLLARRERSGSRLANTGRSLELAAGLAPAPGEALSRAPVLRAPSSARVMPRLTGMRVSPERAQDHDGRNGCTRHSLRVTAVRSPDPKPPQEEVSANSRERARTLASPCHGEVVGSSPIIRSEGVCEPTGSVAQIGRRRLPRGETDRPRRALSATRILRVRRRLRTRRNLGIEAVRRRRISRDGGKPRRHRP
jgi:hypothetical protein